MCVCLWCVFCVDYLRSLVRDFNDPALSIKIQQKTHLLLKVVGHSIGKLVDVMECPDLVFVQKASFVRMLQHIFAKKAGYILTLIHVFPQQILHLSRGILVGAWSQQYKNSWEGSCPNSNSLIYLPYTSSTAR